MLAPVHVGGVPTQGEDRDEQLLDNTQVSVFEVEASDYTNGWDEHGSYRSVAVTQRGPYVRMEGVVQGGTAGTAIFTLPSELWPAGTVRCGNPDGIEISAAGVVTPDAALGNTAVSLDLILYRVGG